MLSRWGQKLFLAVRAAHDAGPDGRIVGADQHQIVILDELGLAMRASSKLPLE